MITLENWSVITDHLYAAPELGLLLLNGQCYNHDDLRHYDGKWISTSYIREVNGNAITTSNGTVYHLGKPADEYVAWCKKTGAHVPTEEVPIKIT